jgi:hypothetical protein
VVRHGFWDLLHLWFSFHLAVGSANLFQRKKTDDVIGAALYG